MDLGIKGRTAIVCAGSKGLGRGCAMALAEAGVNLVINSRGAEALEKTAQEIRDAHGVEVRIVAGDVSGDEIQRELVGQANDLAGGTVDILVNNNGGPPPGMWTDWEREDWDKALTANMITPIMLMKAVLPGMIEQRWGKVVNITSASVKTPIAVLGLSNSARAGLTGYVAGTSRQVAPHGVNINNLLPGSHATDRIAALDANAARQGNMSLEEARAKREANIPARRTGTAEEFGATCAFMCSVHAGFMVGQNILLDGGAFNATQ